MRSTPHSVGAPPIAVDCGALRPDREVRGVSARSGRTGCQDRSVPVSRGALLRWQFDLTWSLWELHLEQLQPEDFLWEPATRCWTVRPGDEGVWVPDWQEPEPELPPFPRSAGSPGTSAGGGPRPSITHRGRRRETGAKSDGLVRAGRPSNGCVACAGTGRRLTLEKLAKPARSATSGSATPTAPTRY
jgi:hypothetical protein